LHQKSDIEPDTKTDTTLDTKPIHRSMPTKRETTRNRTAEENETITSPLRPPKEGRNDAAHV